MLVKNALNFGAGFELVGAVFDNCNLSIPNASSRNVVENRAQINDTEEITQDRNKNDVSELQSLLDNVVLRRVSVNDEEVEVLLSESIVEVSAYFQIVESSELESFSEVVLFVKVDSESAQALSGGNLSENEADGGLADAAFVVPERNSELLRWIICHEFVLSLV